MLKGYVVTDEESAMLVLAESQSRAKAVGFSHWYHDQTEYIYFTARRYPQADGLSDSPVATDDDEILRPLGWQWACEDCYEKYLAGDDHRCGAIEL